MSANSDAPEDVGWRLDVDSEAGELRIEHDESGHAYVLDEDGGLSVPGEGDGQIGGRLDELRTTLTAALEESGGDAGSAAVDQQGSACRVECNQNGDVIIESDTRISLDAPAIDLSADGSLEATAAGVLTLQGSLIKLN